MDYATYQLSLPACQSHCRGAEQLSLWNLPFSASLPPPHLPTPKDTFLSSLRHFLPCYRCLHVVSARDTCRDITDLKGKKKKKWRRAKDASALVWAATFRSWSLPWPPVCDESQWSFNLSAAVIGWTVIDVSIDWPSTSSPLRLRVVCLSGRMGGDSKGAKSVAKNVM